ncbi:hypothetical protein A0H81_02514 [Grifola frondosa]|uniref:SAP domain-containing protein n=1 Tax=Grifola frondosa TaxID=5627 RepID=A0A1C7ML90_GRIFR|nr:hypothetical protein A0H81_02514 [Grifola frondosa]
MSSTGFSYQDHRVLRRPPFLVFVHDPALSEALHESCFDFQNVGTYALKSNILPSRNFLEHESWLLSTRATLQAIESCGNSAVAAARELLSTQIEDELRRLSDVKHLEWERQRTTRGPPVHGQPLRVDTDRYFDIQSQLWTPRNMIIQASYVLVLLLHLVYGLPRRATQVLLAGLRCIIQISLKFARGDLTPSDQHLISRICRDPETVVAAFDLEPSVKCYLCCPKCYAVYDRDTSPPDICTYQVTATSAPCNAKLWRKCNTLPTLSRHYLDKAPEEKNGPMKDIFDGEVFRSFLGPDGKPFLSASAREVRLIFSLNVDGFNPFQMKEGKQNVTSTAMYMVCLNLPPHLRYLPENVYLAGVIPGPGKPHLDQLNHFLALIVDELVTFWEPGVEYTRSCKFVSGCRVLAALVPLVSDIPAARQAEKRRHREPRTSYMASTDLEFHRSSAEEWRTAGSATEREAAFLRNGGIRYSELLRLPYWDPIRFVVIDSMHNLYLGIIKNHIREIWGISVDADDALQNMLAQRMWQACTVASMRRPQFAACRDNQDADETSRKMARSGGASDPIGVPDPACFFHGTGPCPTATIRIFCRKFHDQLPKNPSEEELEKAEKTLKNAKSAKTLQNKGKGILVALCDRRGLLTEGIKADLACRLFEWRESHHQSANVKGKETLEEFLKDRSRMELPSWITPAPVGFGTTQHGKLSADQWKTVGTINLPITLIRTWGSETGRRLEMLRNFMEAVEAIEIIGLREIDASHIEIAGQCMQRYLKSVVLLHKEAKVLPNHHFTLHLPEFLRLFGPVHAWRTFAFERFNHLLQSTNTNMNFGELEMTYMRHSCRAANLRPLLQHPTVREALGEAITVHNHLFNEDKQGTRLDDIVRGITETTIRSDSGTRHKELSLDETIFSALLRLINSNTGPVAYVDERLKVKASSADPRRFQDYGKFLAVERLVELTGEDKCLDNFRTFKYAGGRLCYARYHELIHVIRPTDVTCHFRKTSMDDLKLSEKCVHVRPLDRLMQIMNPSLVEDSTVT